MSVSQIFNAFNGYYDREKERNKALKIITWETARWEAFIMWNLHVTKKGRLQNPMKLIKFEWETKEEKITPEQWDEINKKFPDKQRNGNK